MMKPRTEEDDDDEDHGGLVKKIMETKKEYEQTRKTEIVSWKGGRCVIVSVGRQLIRLSWFIDAAFLFCWK